MRIYKIQYCATLLVMVSLLFSVCVSCTDDIDLQMEQQKAGFKVVGDPVQVHLSISVKDLSMDATRAEEPTADADTTANDEEKHIDDLWIFEYNMEGTLICKPQRVEITDQNELDDLDVTLANNNGNPVIIYAVANAGSGVEENSKNWANNESSGYTGFSTIEDLKAQAIPTPHPQRMTWDAEEKKYVLDTQDAEVLSIPMAGSVGEDESVKATADAEISILVERMFAKLMLLVDLSDFDGQEDQTATLYTLTLGNIPEYCTVGTLWDGEKGNDAKAADYSACSQWLQRRFVYIEGVGSDGSVGDDGKTIYPYIIYMPENIQGESNKSGSNKAENAPEGNALTAEVALYVTDEYDVTFGPYTYTAYPGGNESTNFNVRRNCVYRVKMKVNYPILIYALPSANCIICPSGETTAFWPYCREEVGGGYDFEDYLYAYSDSDEGYDSSKKGQKIDHVGIIWQSTNGGNTVEYNETATGGYIGDNTEGNLVWIDDLGKEEAIDEYNRRIYVRIPEGMTGNALIGAYNSNGEIIWSWHIWSRKKENDPTTVNTKLYYTYEWDANGIYGRDSERPRVAGYTVMNCNLGAMQDDPSGSVYAPESGQGQGTNGFNNARPTFGTLYQWGRKDPFPPVTAYIAQYNYGGGTITDSNPILEYNTETVGKYFDNENKEVTIVGTNTSSALFYSVPGTERKVFDEMIPLTIQNPTVFYAGTNAVNQKKVSYIAGLNSYTQEQTQNILNTNFPDPHDGNWMLDSENDHYNRLWGGLDPEKDMEQITKTYNTGLTSVFGEIHLYNDYGEKSIFDPCPYGWRVSPPELWLGFTVDGLNAGTLSSKVSFDNINCVTDETKSSYSGMLMYMTAWREGETSFFPCQGTRSPDGCAYKSGQCGNYNNATADVNDRVNTLHVHYSNRFFNIFENENLPYFIKSSAGPLRCVRIDSVQQ